MIFPWSGMAKNTNLAKKHNIAFVNTYNQPGVIVYLEIDNRKCSIFESLSECFPTAIEAAEFLAAKASRHSLSESFPIYQVDSQLNPFSPDHVESPNAGYIIMGIVLVVIIAAFFGVLVSNQRKRAAGITWFPEGFLRSSNISTASSLRQKTKRRVPDGQELRDMHINNHLRGHNLGTVIFLSRNYLILIFKQKAEIVFVCFKMSKKIV